jgi:hypothetical protein
MGMEVPQSVAAEEDASNGVACRPGILVVGSKDVGKRTILNSAFFTYSLVSGRFPLRLICTNKDITFSFLFFSHLVSFLLVLLQLAAFEHLESKLDA